MPDSRRRAGAGIRSSRNHRYAVCGCTPFARAHSASFTYSLKHQFDHIYSRNAEQFRTLNAELLDRATRDDYHEWLSGAEVAGGCVRPIRVRGTIRNVAADTGEVLSALDTEDTPDKVIYLPCGDRRASFCPPCAATYRSDTYQLIRAGLAGGKGMPASIATHPCVFATFTAPSFGPVHSRVVSSGGKVARCRPRRKADFCPAPPDSRMTSSLSRQ